MQSMRLIVTALASAIFALTACSQQKYDPAEKVAGQMTEAAGDLSATQANVHSAVESLNSLSSSTGGDLRAKYDAFSKALKSLNASAKEVNDRATAMRQRGQGYFDAWDKEAAAIKNEDIRARSEARRNEVRQQFERVRTLYQDAKAQFTPFQSDLNDIHTALGTDLTPAGLASVRDVVERATTEGSELQETIASLATEFKTLGAQVSPAGK